MAQRGRKRGRADRGDSRRLIRAPERSRSTAGYDHPERTAESRREASSGAWMWIVLVLVIVAAVVLFLFLR